MNVAVSYSIALALYNKNCAGLVPISGPRAGQPFGELPILRCEKVVITQLDGGQVVHNPAEEAKLSYTTELAPYRINAESIIAHLAVTEPDGTESKYQVPLEVYMHGTRYEESICLTGSQPRSSEIWRNRLRRPLGLARRQQRIRSGAVFRGL